MRPHQRFAWTVMQVPLQEAHSRRSQQGDLSWLPARLRRVRLLTLAQHRASPPSNLRTHGLAHLHAQCDAGQQPVLMTFRGLTAAYAADSVTCGLQVTIS